MNKPTTNAVVKSCTKCGETKPLTEYHKNPRSRHGYRTECKVCRSARNKAYREANREKLAESDKAHHAANREQRIAAMKAYRESNRERVLAIKRSYREANREKIAESARAYRKANPHVDYAANLRRRRLLAGAVQETYRREDIFERDAWMCGICGRAIDPQLRFPDQWSSSIDHIVPVSRGGNDTRANVQAAHLKCNISKQDRVGFKIA